MKSILVIIFNLILFFTFFILFFFYDITVPVRRKNSLIVETEYGDSFTIVYTVNHVFLKNMEECTIKDNNSDFFIRSEDCYMNGNLNEKDLIGLYCDSDLRVYQTGNTVIYDNGNGFQIFDEDNSDSETQLIKDIIDKDKVKK